VIKAERSANPDFLLLRLLALMAILAFSWLGCKSPTSPGGGGEADIVITNDYEEGIIVDIYMDGEFKFSLDFKMTIEIDNVSLDEHTLEARVHATDAFIDSETIDVLEYTDYYWTVDDPPDIKVINQFDKSLQIFMDGVYQFDLARKEGRWIINVAYGERFLMAVGADDGREVASTTIRVKENTDYSWTIE
jgi:hypothetical protein